MLHNIKAYLVNYF